MTESKEKECDFENEILSLLDEFDENTNEESEWDCDEEMKLNGVDLAISFQNITKHQRLSECQNDEERNDLIAQMGDMTYSEQKYKEYSVLLCEMKDHILKSLKLVNKKLSIQSLNQILEAFQMYNETLEMVKGFDEDVFASCAVLDSGMPYTDGFAEVVNRMRFFDEEKKNITEKNNVEIEETIEIVQALLSGDDELFCDENGIPLTGEEDEFQEDILEGSSFQTCLQNQKKMFELERFPFYLLTDCFDIDLKNEQILDSDGHVGYFFYKKEFKKILELNARLFSQQFVDEYFFQKRNVFIDVQEASKECFKPVFVNVLTLRKNLFSKKDTFAFENENKLLIKNVENCWNKLVECINEDDKLSQSENWKRFVQSVEDGNVEKIEETWILFERSANLLDEIKVLYFDFIIALMKKVTSVPVYPSKNIPISPFKMVLLLDEIEKKEFLNLKRLLKWVLKCILIDFQTFINMPLLKRAMKDMHETIKEVLNDELKKVFYIYKKSVQQADLLNRIRIEKLIQVSSFDAENNEAKIYKNDKYENSLLLKSIEQNDYKKFCSLLEKGVLVDDVTSYGETALLLLAKLKRYDWVDVLLKYKPNLNAFDFNGCTCAHYFSEQNNVKMLRRIFKLGANFNRTNLNEDTPLIIAVNNSNFESVKFLVDSGVSIDKKGGVKKTPLHIALERGDKKIVSYLIEKGADIFVRDGNSNSCLHFAAESGMLAAISFFVHAGLNVNTKNRQYKTALHIACMHGKKDVVKCLIDFEADVNAKDVYGQTPLHVATAVGSLNCVNLLIGNEADIDCVDNQGQTALYLGALNQQKKPFKELLKQGSKVHTKAADLSSVMSIIQSGTDRALKSCLKKYEENGSFFDMMLFLGIFRENKALVEKAIEKGIHLKELKIGGKNALEWALEFGNIELIDLIYRNNATKSKEIKKNIGHSSLIKSIIQNNISDLKLLLKAGADANGQDEGTKHSVLHYACVIGNIKAIQVLIENGANINIQNIKGRTPLFIARQMQQYEVEKLLLSLGAKDDENSKPVSYLNDEK